MQLRALIAFAFLLVPVSLPAQEICVSTPEGRDAALRMVSEVNALQQAAPVPWMRETLPRLLDPTPDSGTVTTTPWGTPLPGWFTQYGQPEKPPTEIDRDLIPDARPCLGQYQCLHDVLHPFYKTAFKKLGCHCHTGRCRPTEARRVNTSADNETGYQVLANGRWCDVPAAALRRDRQQIPSTLLQFRAHVCVSPTSCAELECAIIDEGT